MYLHIENTTCRADKVAEARRVPSLWQGYHLQRREPLQCLLVPMDRTCDGRQTARNGASKVQALSGSQPVSRPDGRRREKHDRL
jgi:hypothetical protein